MGYLHGFGWVGIALLIEADCTTTAVKATAAALTNCTRTNHAAPQKKRKKKSQPHAKKKKVVGGWRVGEQGRMCKRASSAVMCARIVRWTAAWFHADAKWQTFAYMLKRNTRKTRTHIVRSTCNKILPWGPFLNNLVRSALRRRRRRRGGSVQLVWCTAQPATASTLRDWPRTRGGGRAAQHPGAFAYDSGGGHLRVNE